MIFSTDTLFAVITVLVILFVGFSTLSVLIERTFDSYQRNEKESKLLRISDYLVKQKIAQSDSERLYQHKVEITSIRSLDLDGLIERTGVESISISLISRGRTLVKRGEGTECIRRVIWVSEIDEVGYLETCIG